MNKFFTPLFYLFITNLINFSGVAQELTPTRVFTLDQVVQLAQTQSPSYRYNSVLLENRKWQNKVFKSHFFPQLNLNGVLPEYNKTIEPILTDNGSLTFINTHNANSSLQLSLGQELWITGGHISINSQVKRLDDFQASVNGTRYSAVPATITLNQPIFNFRWLTWEKKIQPLRFEEAKREYWERMEGIAVDATHNYFNLLLSQISYQIAQKNVANTDTLYKISSERFTKGQIQESELLQLELTLLNARQNLEQTKLDVEGNILRLKVYLGLTDDESIHLMPPTGIPNFEVDEKIAVEQAEKNRPRTIAFERELLEAELNLARAKGETGINANLFASFGLTQQAADISQVYQDPSQQQRFRLGFNVPIMDWGRTAARVGTAKANKELVSANVEQQKINFKQDIYLNAKRFKVLRSQMDVAKRTDEIAERRYSLTKERYMNGKISVLDLNVATEERDKATRSYINSLHNFWANYYHLRQITLFDFELMKPLLPLNTED